MYIYIYIYIYVSIPPPSTTKAKLSNDCGAFRAYEHRHLRVI